MSAYQASHMTCLHAIQPPESMYSQHKLVIFTVFVNGGKTYTMIGHLDWAIWLACGRCGAENMSTAPRNLEPGAGSTEVLPLGVWDAMQGV